MQKFLKELSTLAQIRHPNLLLLMGVCIDSPNLCIITEYVDNKTLFYALHKNKKRRLDMDERFDIAIQICRGLVYLHSNSSAIIHRDLKPENILLDSAYRVKIADFGLARPLSMILDKSEETTMCIGTTRFMAPELFDKEQIKHAGIEIDIWALGGMLIEIFSGKRPWDHISSQKVSCVYYEIFKKVPVPIPDRIPTDVAKIIQQCCNYNPKKRPSAETVLSYLDHLRSNN